MREIARNGSALCSAAGLTVSDDISQCYNGNDAPILDSCRSGVLHQSRRGSIPPSSTSTGKRKAGDKVSNKQSKKGAKARTPHAYNHLGTCEVAASMREQNACADFGGIRLTIQSEYYLCTGRAQLRYWTTLGCMQARKKKAAGAKYSTADLVLLMVAAGGALYFKRSWLLSTLQNWTCSTMFPGGGRRLGTSSAS